MINVGDKIKEERKEKGVTLEQVAKATKIRASFLEAIENGEYEKLPGSSYAHGFVKNYLEYLELPVSEYLARFRREYDGERQRKLIPEGMIGKENISLKRFSIRQAIWLGGIVILALFVYLFYQYRAAFFPPQLIVDSPKENAVVAAQAIAVSGITDPNVAVTINALPAYVDANGKFTKQLPVFPGNLVITVKAVNSFGKISSIERHVQIKVE
ncbi:MAG TPA: helix-turn-helix domain-containing protein [Patescibacteria group bacterium]|nr:helix-turn-helix domain-containing protein [Patescibacteria group bacterium]